MLDIQQPTNNFDDATMASLDSDELDQLAKLLDVLMEIDMMSGRSND